MKGIETCNGLKIGSFRMNGDLHSTHADLFSDYTAHSSLDWGNWLEALTLLKQ